MPAPSASLLLLLGGAVPVWATALMAVLLCSLRDKGPGRLARAARASRRLLHRFRQLLIGVLGDRLWTRLEAVFHYVVLQRNPLMMVVYSGLAATMMRLCHLHVFALLPDSVHVSLLWCVFTACLATFALCVVSSPGVITAGNHSVCKRRYDFDGLLYTPNRTCRTCRFEKVARSKHCRFCDVCVARFDHHCVWLNVCIGAGNLGRFLVFLAVHACACLYVSVLCCVMLYGVVVKQSLLTATFVDRDGHRIPPSYLNVCIYLSIQYSGVVLLWALAGTFSMFLLGFLGFHTYLIVVNRTTNENTKLDDLREDLDDQSPTDKKKYLGRIQSSKVFYSRGILHNVADALFGSPRSTCSRST